MKIHDTGLTVLFEPVNPAVEYGALYLPSPRVLILI